MLAPRNITLGLLIFSSGGIFLRLELPERLRLRKGVYWVAVGAIDMVFDSGDIALVRERDRYDRTKAGSVHHCTRCKSPRRHPEICNRSTDVIK